MSLTTEERERIMYYLGYPAGDLSSGWGKVVNTACDRITSTPQQEVVRGILRGIQRLDQLKHNTLPFAAQTFSSGANQGTTQYLPGQRLETLHREGRSLIRQLANYLQLQVYADIYGGGWQSSGLVRG